jgi:RNA polymerase sigma-70 factor (ECF subfamily)
MRGMKKSAFERFLTEHGDRIYGYVFYFLRNREDAQDVTQEVFVKLWEHWPHITPEGAEAFAMRTAHNKCIDATRRRKTSESHLSPAQWPELESIPAPRAANVDPELSLELTETQRAILRAMDSLPARTRGVLLMHYFQGLKHETIGRILGMKTGTVKVTIHRGRVLLRAALTRRFPETAVKYSDERTMH